MDISKRIYIVLQGDGGRRVLVDGQDITGWMSAASGIDVHYGGINTLPTLTLTLTADEIRTQHEH